MFKLNNNVTYKYGYYLHKCKAHLKAGRKAHHKQDEFRALPSYGDAVGSIVFSLDMDCWLAFNDEYATIINYCPFCGKELEEV